MILIIQNYSQIFHQYFSTTYLIHHLSNPPFLPIPSCILRSEGDITKIEADSIPDFHILCAGFPCQPFSIAGKKRGFRDTRGTLFFDIAEIVRAKQPEVVFLENVPNLARYVTGNTLRVILDTLDGLGYDVYYQVLNAAYYGVPQIRKRSYFVCFRKDLQVDFVFPEPTFQDAAVEDCLEESVDEKYYLDINSITFYKPDTDVRQLDTYRMGLYRKYQPGKARVQYEGLHAYLYGKCQRASRKYGSLLHPRTSKAA